MNAPISEHAVEFIKFDELSSISIFRGKGGCDEYHLCLRTIPKKSYSSSLKDLDECLLRLFASTVLSEETLVFSRIYLSDIANQKMELMRSTLYQKLSKGSLSVIQQCPLDGGEISVLSYHLKSNSNPIRKRFYESNGNKWRNAIQIAGRNYDQLWTANYSGYGPLDSQAQSAEVFESYTHLLNEHGMSLLRNAIRSWIYVRDIDNNYHGMVQARASHYAQQGLNGETRFLASTGIEARMKDVYSLVSMDALAVSNLAEGQISRVSAPDHLCSAFDYGVTFERGLSVQYGDRKHLFISGTASIDPTGHIVHPVDVEKQTHRTLENVSALVQSHGASLLNFVEMIVYLRNIKNADAVRKILQTVIPEEIPMVIVEGSVCRPNWLVEIEGIAITPTTSDYPDFM